MRARALLILLVTLGALAGSATPGFAVPTTPANFAIDDAAPGAGFADPTGFAFLPDGRFLVSEKRGRVYEVRNAVKRTTPIWSAENEVLNISDMGLLGIAVDPRYYLNHYVYFLYVVDPDSNGIDDTRVSFTRLTRYTVNFTDSATVIPASRTILMGDSWTSGALSCSGSHSAGALRWGRDGSLLLTVGDGAHYEYTDAGGNDAAAFGPGRTNAYEDIGSFRSQDITVLGGKVLRINPATGHGYASNPFATTNLASAQSRVWCYGLRNPFRFTLKPGTGSADTAAANPGTLLIGDVGYNTWEEMDVATAGGANFGWPCFEGVGGLSAYQSATPAHNGCSSFGSATNPSAARSPLSTWDHGSGTASIPTGLTGNCSIGGAFYSGAQYPSPYRNQYVFADFGQNWIKLATLDTGNNLVGVSSFIDAADGPVDFGVDPISGDIFYCAIIAQQIRRIRYTAAGAVNNPPVAAIAASPLSGATPLTVSFSSAGSSDPDGDPLTFTWAFGDATGSTLANPTHQFTTPGVYNVQLTVSDGRGGTSIKYIAITAGAGVVGFPSTPVLDRFDRADGPVGPPWIDQTAGFAINGNTLAPAASGASMEWNGTTFGPDQEVFVTLAAFATGSGEQDLMLKTQGSSWSAGYIEVGLSGASSSVSVHTLQSGTVWTMVGTVTGVTFVPGDQFGARALANGTLQVFRNGAVIGTFSVAGWPYAGSGGHIGVSYDNAAATRFDNFGGGNVVSNANTPPLASIVSPLNNSFYYAGQTVTLSGSATDAQSPADSLAYSWIVDLYHNNHVHPSTYSLTGKTTSFVGANHDDGTGVHLKVKLTASDPRGAVSDTVKIDIWPEIDLTASAVTVTPDPPIAGQPARYAFALNNSGRMPAPLSHWVLRAGGTVVAQGDTIVPASGSVLFGRDAILPNSGAFTLRLTADSLAAVHETNESNNASVRSLTINPAAVNRAPVAAATATPQSAVVPFTASFSGAASTDPDGDPLTFAWAFGDGGTAIGKLASHTFSSAGSYATILTVNDGRGGTDTASVAITAVAATTGFPRTPVLDNFNRASGPLGANWMDQPSRFWLTANTLVPKAGDAYIEWNPTVFGPEQEAFVTLSAVTSSSTKQGLMLKTQGISWSSGHIEVAYYAATAKVVVSTFTPPASWTTRGTLSGVTFLPGSQFGARASSNGDVRIYRNGALLGTVSVAGWSFAAVGGRIGLSCSNATTTRFDDFGGGSVPSGATATATPLLPAGGFPRLAGMEPREVIFSGAFPNPTRGGVAFTLLLPSAAEVSMAIFDIQGRAAWNMSREIRPAGRWTLEWDGSADGGPAAAGVYLAMVRMGGQSWLRRFAIVR